MSNGQTSTAIVPFKQKVESVRVLLDKAKPQIKLALPKHLNPDRMLRIAMTSVQRTPQLLDCDPTSLIAAVIQSAQLGLEPDGALGHAYLIPFGKTATLIPGYRGLVDLARRSGQLSTISAHVVYEKDAFRYTYGLDEKLVHEPYDGDEDPGKMTHAYAVAKLKDGGIQFTVMSRREIMAIKNGSPGAKKSDSPWNHKDREPEMWKKTAIRRLAKLLPMSIEMAQAIRLDEQAEAGLPQDLDVIDTTAEPADKAPTSIGDLAGKSETPAA